MSIYSDTGPFAIVPEWVLDLPISPLALRLYAVLARYADKNGQAHPSRQEIAKRLDCSPRHVTNLIEELTNAGALSVRPRYVEGAGQTSNDYLVMRKHSSTPLELESKPPLELEFQPGTRTTFNEKELKAPQETIFQPQNLNGKLPCPECGVLWKTKARLAEHRYNVHNVGVTDAVSLRSIA